MFSQEYHNFRIIYNGINRDKSQKLIKKIESNEIDSIHLIYDEMSIRDYWLEHLDWLNDYLEVRTKKKQTFNHWFSKF